MEVEHCIRADGEEIRNFLHRTRKTVDKGWPDDIVGITLGDQNAERTAQAGQRRQRYIDYTLKGLRPRYLQRKAQEYLMEHPNATRNDFSTNLINKNVSYQVSTSFLNDKEQNKAELASLWQELKNLRAELKAHKINALEGNQRPINPNQKWRQNATMFCGFCRTNGHTPNYCRKKMRDEEIKKLQNEATTEKKVTFTQDYNKKRGPSHGSVKWTSRNDGNWALTSTPRSFTRGNFRPSNQNPNNFRQNRLFERGDYTNNNNDRYNDYRARSPYQSNQDQSRNWGKIMTIRDCLQRHDKIRLLRILVDNPDQIRLCLQCLTGLGIGTRAAINPTKKNSQPLTTVISPTWFNLLQQTMKLTDHWDYAF